MTSVKELTLVTVIFSCLLWKVDGQATSATGATQGPATVPPTTPVPAGQCPNNYCLNGGTCRVCSVTPSLCPANANLTYYCNCAADYVNFDCGSKRAAAFATTLKSTQNFTTDLNNPSSTAYQSLAASFMYIGQRAYEFYYTGKGFDVAVSVKILNFYNGSVFANTLVSVGPKPGQTGAITYSQPNSTDMTTSLNGVCAGTMCSSIGLDTNTVTVAAAPSLCLSNATNQCSQYATCTFHSGVNYTCACPSNYRDDGSGYICTIPCVPTSCTSSTRGTCTEVRGGAFTCACNAGYTGTTCQNGSYRVQQSTVLLVFFSLILPLAIFKPMFG
jgi:hypothetical protein